MAHQQPSPDSFHHLSGWRCPLCLYTMYEPVEVRKPNGGTYRTDFYQCGRCSNMFRDPARYARLGVPVRRWANDVGPKTLDEAHRYWSDGSQKQY